ASPRSACPSACCNSGSRIRHDTVDREMMNRNQQAAFAAAKAEVSGPQQRTGAEVEALLQPRAFGRKPLRPVGRIAEIDDIEQPVGLMRRDPLVPDPVGAPEPQP